MLILYTQRRTVTDSGKEATSDNAELHNPAIHGQSNEQ